MTVGRRAARRTRSAASGEILDTLGADVRLGDEQARELPDGPRSSSSPRPGWRPDAPLLVAAAAAGVPVWGEVELAWRLRRLDDPAPWLVVTGTNGKTTTVQMLASMLQAAGRRAAAAGNVGHPARARRCWTTAARALRRARGRAVELPAALDRTRSAPLASAVLNVAPDHLDWHGSLADYAADKGRVYEHTQVACVYNVADPQTERLVARRRRAVEGCRAVGFTLGVAVGRRCSASSTTCSSTGPSSSSASDSAAGARRRSPTSRPFAPHNVANALAAAALARAYGVPAGRGPRRPARVPARRRTASPLVGRGRRGAPTSTTPRRPTRTPRCVAARLRPRGVDRRRPGQGRDVRRPRAPGRRDGCAARAARPATGRTSRHALARHAPEVPVIEVASTDTGVMDEVVQRRRARWPGRRHRAARPGVRVDGHVPRLRRQRGDAFAAAVRRAGHGQRPVSSTTSAGGPAAPDARPTGRRGPAVVQRRGPGSPVTLGATLRVLDRPLTSYYLLLGCTSLLLGARPGHGAVGVERRGVPDRRATRCRSSSKQAAVGVHRRARGVASRRARRCAGTGGLAIPAARRGVRAAVPGARPGRRGERQRQPELDQLRRAVPAAALRGRQARAGAVGARTC